MRTNTEQIMEAIISIQREIISYAEEINKMVDVMEIKSKIWEAEALIEQKLNGRD